MQQTRNIWLFSKKTDLLVLGAPVWLVWLVCFMLPDTVLYRDVPLWVWVVFVLGVDVSHVWSTLFRTYLDRDEWSRHSRLLIWTPVICFAVFFVLSRASVELFWTVLAYVALYHFIKQQYGFMQLYRARYGFVSLLKKFSDKLIIYLGMLYPVAYWHFSSDRNFSWFVPGDFFNVHLWFTNLPFWQDSYTLLIPVICTTIYFALLVGWLAEEVWLHRAEGLAIPLGKWLWVLTTWGNWYLGIVFFNSDLVFTITNVVAHGVPYMALVFFYVKEKRAHIVPAIKRKYVFTVAFMLPAVCVLAYGEEYFWDLLLYQEHTAFFGTVLSYPIAVLTDPTGQAFALSLLTLPQATHYVLDGYIWKANEKNPHIKTILLQHG